MYPTPAPLPCQQGWGRGRGKWVNSLGLAPELRFRACPGIHISNLKKIELNEHKFI